MVITLSGRRIDPVNAAVVRFPLEHSAMVRERIRAIMQEHQATALVSSAACGTDLLALSIAGELGIRRRIVLPFPPERFRASSVVDRPGEWEELFDQIIKEVEAAGDLVILNEEREDNTAYLHTNQATIDEAQRLARQAARDTGSAVSSAILAIIVWEGQPRGTDDITAAFASEARARSIPIVEVLTR
jgi:hypothetical protein